MTAALAVPALFAHTAGDCSVCAAAATPAEKAAAPNLHAVAMSPAASHEPCRFSRRGCLHPDVTAAGIAAAAARWAALTADQTSEGFRFSSSYRGVTEFRDVRNGRLARWFIRTCGGDLVESADAIYAPTVGRI